MDIDVIWDVVRRLVGDRSFRWMISLGGNDQDQDTAPQSQSQMIRSGDGREWDERLHRWILSWIFTGKWVRDGRRVYYRDSDGGTWHIDDDSNMKGVLGKGVIRMTRVKVGDLTLEERETAIIGNAAERGVWRVYTDDPVMMGKLERLGLVPVMRDDGVGREYILAANQLSFRRKRVVDEAERQRKSEAARRAFGHGSGPTKGYGPTDKE